ncbi:prostate and testis expressed protein 13-like [Meriones unguiculatus]|uniref:prostate and testis expressed protein 13-like n=1 Tax=Meriones unguiculatus TaxID=10047 RepID=UPI00293F589E|nr:prostate and testis expressed protein 13-like [Meriones unguiculatus]
MFRMFLLSVSIIFLMDTGERVVTGRLIKYCNLCSHHDGFKCRSGMQKCWKFELFSKNRTCATENFYFYNRITGMYLYRYSKLSCKPCATGMYQIFHDLLRETFCCTDKSFCNDGTANLDISTLLLETQKEMDKKLLND